MTADNNIPPIVTLRYAENDLIIKQGDYGISIYTIISGKVGIFIDSGETEICLATLGPGEIFGEMIFLDRGTVPRSASARAMTPVELEVWHPKRLASAYAGMPPMLKYVTDQALMRLVLMNRKITALSNKRKKLEEDDPWISQRKFYRREVNLDCKYRPLNAPGEEPLWGRIQDISKGGMKLIVSFMNTKRVPHRADSRFVIATLLGEGKRFQANARVISVEKTTSPAKVSMRMAFVQLSEEAQKILGFFLMR
jgi:CRP-like cAMP-binding protein